MKHGEFIVPDYIEVHVTTDAPEAANRICMAVVRARLAACAQVSSPIRSTYWWQGEVEQADEYFITMKSTRERFADLAHVIRENHPYDVPEIIALPVVDGDSDYLNWISSETRATGESA